MNTLEKILEEIESDKKYSLPIEASANHNYREGYVAGMTLAQEIIKEHLNDGWIPVEERLPDDSNPEEECVLVTVNGKCRNVKFDNAVMIGGHYLEGWVIDGWEEWTNPNVTAWMPLPEGWKGE